MQINLTNEVAEKAKITNKLTDMKQENEKLTLKNEEMKGVFDKQKQRMAMLYPAKKPLPYVVNK